MLKFFYILIYGVCGSYIIIIITDNSREIRIKILKLEFRKRFFIENNFFLQQGIYIYLF